MPGSNHDIDASFMDALPFSLREAALNLLRYSSLSQMLEMVRNEPSDYLGSQFSLTSQQWNQVLNAVILTKISYFQISLEFPDVYINKLLEIAAFSFGMSGSNPAELYQAMLNQHPVFAEWIKKSLMIKQQKTRLKQGADKQKAKLALDKH